MDQHEFSGIPYPAMPDVARVAVICAKYAMYGIVPLPVPPVFQDIPIPTERIPCHEGTDLAYLNQLAEEVGHTFYIEPGPLPGHEHGLLGTADQDRRPAAGAQHEHGRAHQRRVADLLDQPQRQGDAGRVRLLDALEGGDPDPDPGRESAPAPARRRPAVPEEVRADEGHGAPVTDRGARPRLARAAARPTSSPAPVRSTSCGTAGCSRRAAWSACAARARPSTVCTTSRASQTSLKRGECKQSFSLTRNALVSITPRVPV